MINKDDASNFVIFANEFNKFIDKIIDDDIQECFKLSKKLYSRGMATPAINFINMIPQQFFTDLNVYKAMLRHTSWSDEIFAKYANFKADEIKEATKLFSHPSNDQTFRQVQRLFNDFVTVISEKTSIPEELAQFTSFLLIRKGAMEVFSKQWKDHYDAIENCSNTQNYIREFILLCKRFCRIL